MKPLTSHIPLDVLAAFNLGNIAEAEIDSVVEHLEHCETCCQHLRHLDTETNLLGELHLLDQTININGQATSTLKPLASYRKTEQRPFIPGYELLGELGRGGMGIVYEAVQIGLNRRVAVKILYSHSGVGPLEIDRFRSEAIAIARLQHPNVVRVYETGTHEQTLYIVFELVTGGTLAMWSQREVVQPVSAVQMLINIAAGVQAAHEAGIIHRDLKPSNILLTPAEKIPKISDFGLAKILDESLTQTFSGIIAGTPTYMAPEQTLGNVAITPSADIYSLGVVLYELLTGRPPFTGLNIVDAFEQVRHHEPVSIRRLQPKIARDLETICLKCLQKDPKSRYRTVAELSDDLQRFLDQRPINARPPGVVGKTVKLIKRFPWYAGLIMMLSVSILIGLTGVMYQYFQTEKARANAVDESRERNIARLFAEEKKREAEAAQQSAEAATIRAQELSAQIALDQAILECDAGRVRHGLELLKQADDFVTERNFALKQAIQLNRSAWQHHDLTPTTLAKFRKPPPFVMFSPDGNLLLIADTQQESNSQVGIAELWEIKNKHHPRLKVQHPRGINTLCFHPNGKTFATGGNDGEIHIWDATNGTKINSVKPSRFKEPIQWIDYSPSGDRLAISYAINQKPNEHQFIVTTFCIWNFTRQDYEVQDRPYTSAQLRFCWHPTKNEISLAFPTNNSTVGVLQTTYLNIQRTSKMMIHPQPITSLAYTRDGKITTACLDGFVRFWENETPLTRNNLRHQMPVTSIAFTHQDQQLIVGIGNDDNNQLSQNSGGIYCWDVATSQPIGAIIDNPDAKNSRVIGVTVDHVHGRYAAIHHNGVLSLGKIPIQPVPIASTRVHQPANMVLTPDGQRLLVESRPYLWARFPPQVHVFDASTLQPITVLNNVSLSMASMHPTKPLLLTHHDATPMRSRPQLWSLLTGESLPLPREFAETPLHLCSWTTQDTLITYTPEGQYQEWDTSTFEPKWPPQKIGRILCIDGTGAVLFVNQDGYFLVNRITNKRIQLNSRLPIQRAAFNQNGTHLVTAEMTEQGTRLRSWNVAKGESTDSPRMIEGNVDQFLSNQADFGIVVDQESPSGFFQLIDPITLQPVTAPIVTNKLSPQQHSDGRLFFMQSSDSTVKIRLVTREGKMIGPPLLQSHPIRQVFFQPQTSTYVTLTSAGFIARWHLPELPPKK